MFEKMGSDQRDGVRFLGFSVFHSCETGDAWMQENQRSDPQITQISQMELR